MTTAQVVETSVTVNNNSPIQDYVHPDDQTQPFEMTPGFKPFTKTKKFVITQCACINDGVTLKKKFTVPELKKTEMDDIAKKKKNWRGFY